MAHSFVFFLITRKLLSREFWEWTCKFSLITLNIGVFFGLIQESDGWANFTSVINTDLNSTVKGIIDLVWYRQIHIIDMLLINYFVCVQMPGLITLKYVCNVIIQLVECFPRYFRFEFFGSSPNKPIVNIFFISTRIRLVIFPFELVQYFSRVLLKTISNK